MTLLASMTIPSPRRNFASLDLIFEPRDLWIGAYWKRYPHAIEVYLCVLPVLPIRIYWQWGM